MATKQLTSCPGPESGKHRARAWRPGAGSNRLPHRGPTIGRSQPTRIQGFDRHRRTRPLVAGDAHNHSRPVSRQLLDNRKGIDRLDRSTRQNRHTLTAWTQFVESGPISNQVGKSPTGGQAQSSGHVDDQRSPHRSCKPQWRHHRKHRIR